LDADDDIDDRLFINRLLNGTKAKGWLTSSTNMTARGKAAKSFKSLLAYQKILSHTRRPVASGYCLLTRRDVFEKTGGFNEKIKFGEDYEYVSKTGRGGRFGFVTTTEFFVDPRRNQSHGLKLTWQGTLNEIYRLLLGYKKLEKQPINYEFGKHKRRGD